MPKIAINSKTNGKVRHEMLNGRNHLVTSMRPIVGDTVMNRGLYTDEQVTNSFMQLDQLPVPNGHPTVNGRNVSAFHPLAVNSHNVGAFIRNPVKRGKEVYNELWIDELVANQTPDGIEILKRLNESTKIGVSTGLELDKTVSNTEGLDYDWVGSNFRFDHVALLLNSAPAGGDQTVTVNEDDADYLEMVELQTNEFSFQSVKEQVGSLLQHGRGENEYIYIADVVMDDESSGNVIYELKEEYFMRDFSLSEGVVSLGIKVTPVVRVVTYKELIVGDVPTNLNHAEPKEANMPKAATGDENVTIEQALELLESKGFTVVNAKDAKAKDMEYFLDNKSAIQSLIANQATEEAELRAKVIETNAELTQEEVDGMSISLLRKLAPAKLLANHSLQSGFSGSNSPVTNSADIPDYAPNYSEVV